MSRPYEHTKRRRSASADSIGQAGYIEAQRFTSSPAGADEHAAILGSMLNFAKMTVEHEPMTKRPRPASGSSCRDSASRYDENDENDSNLSDDDAAPVSPHAPTSDGGPSVSETCHPRRSPTDHERLSPISQLLLTGRRTASSAAAMAHGRERSGSTPPPAAPPAGPASVTRAAGRALERRIGGITAAAAAPAPSDAEMLDGHLASRWP